MLRRAAILETAIVLAVFAFLAALWMVAVSPPPPIYIHPNLVLNEPITVPGGAEVQWIAPPRQWEGGGYWYRFGPVTGGRAGVMPLHTDKPFHNHPEWEH